MSLTRLTAADSAVNDVGADLSVAQPEAARRAVIELHRVSSDHLARQGRDMERQAAEAAARQAHTEEAGVLFARLSDACDPRTSCASAPAHPTAATACAPPAVRTAGRVSSSA